MNVMIHACPARMWYVERFLAPSLRVQGIEPLIFCDTERRGNLGAFLASIRELHGDGTWHIQDDVLICRDFAERAGANDAGFCSGFCSSRNGDDPGLTGTVYPPDFWHGFPCVRIPDDAARDFVKWIETGKHSSWADIQIRRGQGDDFIFHEYLETVHGTETVRNIAPNLVEHVDWLIGGSTINEWREGIVRSDLWEDEALVEELKAKLNMMI